MTNIINHFEWAVNGVMSILTCVQAPFAGVTAFTVSWSKKQNIFVAKVAGANVGNYE